MDAESHGQKRMIWPFLPSTWVRLSVLLIEFNLFLLTRVDPSPIYLFLFFYPSFIRSELIRPGLTVRVDPVRLLYLPQKKCRKQEGP